MWNIAWTERGLKDAQRLILQDRERIFSALDRFAQSEQGDVRKLQGERDEWRLRVGDLRVRFTYDRETNEIHILRVLPRGRAYRD